MHPMFSRPVLCRCNNCTGLVLSPGSFGAIIAPAGFPILRVLYSVGFRPGAIIAPDVSMSLFRSGAIIAPVGFPRFASRCNYCIGVRATFRSRFSSGYVSVQLLHPVGFLLPWIAPVQLLHRGLRGLLGISSRRNCSVQLLHPLGFSDFLGSMPGRISPRCNNCTRWFSAALDCPGATIAPERFSPPVQQLHRGPLLSHGRLFAFGG